MKPKPLTQDERKVIGYNSETLLEIVNGADDEFLKAFIKYECLDFQHYMRIQKCWLETEKYLVGCKEGHDPTYIELLDDMDAHKTSLRFRAYYTMAFPNLMRHRERLNGYES